MAEDEASFVLSDGMAKIEEVMLSVSSTGQMQERVLLEVSVVAVSGQNVVVEEPAS